MTILVSRIESTLLTVATAAGAWCDRISDFVAGLVDPFADAWRVVEPRKSSWTNPKGSRVGALARLSPDLNRPEDGSFLAKAKASVPWRDDAVD
jgi:hypothetical protein